MARELTFQTIVGIVIFLIVLAIIVYFAFTTKSSGISLIDSIFGWLDKATGGFVK